MPEMPLTPRPAATLILARDAENGPEVFMVQRSLGATFVPGGFVFPGGALDSGDADAGCMEVLVEQGDRAYRVAAIRECFEEAGLLLAYDANGDLPDFSAPARYRKFAEARAALADGTLGFGELCARFGLQPAIDRLTCMSRWVTPAGLPRRFDTRFYLAPAPSGQSGMHDGQETIDHAWMRPSDALARHRAGQMQMMFATVRTLEELARADNVEDMLARARALPEIVTYAPRAATGKQGRRLLLRGDHAYAEAGKLDPMGNGSTLDHILPGTVTALAAGVRRIAAPNSGFMTGPGTNSYLVGTEAIAVIDPGPADTAHVDRLIDSAGAPIRWIFTTHTHVDHSPGAALLKARTGAMVFGMPAPEAGNQDQGFVPDVVLTHNERVRVDGLTLRAVHTPGHASNHLCYLLEEERMLFTGDHVMQGSTVVINPPDGDMRAYLASLHSLKHLEIDYLAPGHGFLMDQPYAVIDRIVAHRMAREEKLVTVLAAAGAASADDLLPLVYDDVPMQRHAMAARSLLAHLHKLAADGIAAESGGTWHIMRACAS